MKNSSGRAGHHDRRAEVTLGTGPGNGKNAAAGLHINTGIDEPQTNTRHHSRTGPGATGQGFTDTALEHTQGHTLARYKLQKAHVHALRKMAALLYRGPQRGDIGRVHIVHQHHSMGVTHGNGRYQNRSALRSIYKGQWPLLPRTTRLRCHPACIKGDVGKTKHRGPHVHGHAAIGCERGGNDTLLRFHAQHILGGQPLVAHKTGKTARSIATLLHFRAVGVVNDIFKVDVRCRRRPHGQDLVGTHAEMAIPQKAVVRRRQAQATAGFVQHNEVVARALHFGELDSHTGIIRDTRPAAASFGAMPDNRSMPASASTTTIDDHAPWQYEAPVVLTPRVRRLTAPNAGVMTGPGTNSYLIGTPAHGFVVVDPGPADAAHVQRLWQACAHADGSGGNIVHIVCTHSHADHAPGAQPLQALCPHRPAILGLPSAPTARANSEFTPDQSLQNSERLTLYPQGLQANLAPHPINLRAIHTPGHAANHVCLLAEEDALLLSGDHILNGSTTVIDPPDGHMGDYLRSLDTLSALCETWGVRYILPAHGNVLDGALVTIAKLKAHRLRREAKVQAAMQALPHGTPKDWVPLAYDDVDARLWPLALRSLLAHVAHLQEINQAPMP